MNQDYSAPSSANLMSLTRSHDRDGSPIAAEGLNWIKAFYKIETEIRGKSVTERLAVRQARTKPLMADFEDWLIAVRSQGAIGLVQSYQRRQPVT